MGYQRRVHGANSQNKKHKKKYLEMSAFENSWEALDKSRNLDKYETVTTADGKEVTFLKSDNNEKPRSTKEEAENIAKAAEKMNDRDDQETFPWLDLLKL